MSQWEEDGSLQCPKCGVIFDVHEFISPECDGELDEDGSEP